LTLTDVWDKIFSESEWGKYPAESLIRFIAHNFYKNTVRNITRILEVGSGPGPNLWYLAREGFQVYGVEGSKVAVERAVDRLDREVPGWKGEIVQGDIRNLRYPDDFFDAVIDNEAVYTHVFEESQKIYREMLRVLKTDGRLYSRTFATGTYGEGTGKQVGKNTWAVAEGVLANIDISRFTSGDEIPALYSPFILDDVNLLSMTIGGIDSGKFIKEWIVIGHKANQQLLQG
jgi:SAM-dependent methyltransferase